MPCANIFLLNNYCSNRKLESKDVGYDVQRTHRVYACLFRLRLIVLRGKHRSTQILEPKCACVHVQVLLFNKNSYKIQRVFCCLHLKLKLSNAILCQTAFRLGLLFRATVRERLGPRVTLATRSLTTRAL